MIFPTKIGIDSQHAILLSWERVNKGTKRMNSLPLSPVVISYATLHITEKKRYLQALRNTVGLKS